MNGEPIFKSIFGDTWQAMPPVMHKHYANRPFSDDSYSCSGPMRVHAACILRLFGPLMMLMGGIPITRDDNVPTTVHFNSDSDTNHLHFVRRFHFKGRKPYIFHSTMVPIRENIVVEVMKFRLCWCSRFSWQDDRVILAHNGYKLYLFGKFIPLPISWLVGNIHAEEQAISDTAFKMFVEINHPLLGKIYEYHGTFEMDENHD